MKDLSQDYLDHIESGATTLCFCWLLTRTDGQVLGFTDHDQTVSFDGQVFAPAGGFDGAEQPTALGGQTDTGEVLGVLNSDSITEEDIDLGRYDGATVETFRVNWRDPSMRNKQRTDNIGEIVREDSQFRAELRSPQELLNTPSGRRYSHLCDARLGDNRCGVNLDQSQYKTDGTVVQVLSRHSLAISGSGSFDAGLFDHGLAHWTGGKRVDLKDRIVSHTIESSNLILVFAEPVGDWVEAGDEVTVFAGCDRTFEQCKSQFSNAVNFRGFPHIPGRDTMLRFPHSSDSFAGRALVK